MSIKTKQKQNPPLEVIASGAMGEGDDTTDYVLIVKRQLGSKYKHRYLFTVSKNKKIKLVREINKDEMKNYSFKLREFVIASDKEFNEIDFEFFYQIYNGKCYKENEYIIFNVVKFSLDEIVNYKFEKNYHHRTFMDIDSNCTIDKIRYKDSDGNIIEKENEEMEKLNTTATEVTETTATINNFVNEALKKKISLKEIAKASVSPSDLMIGREKIDSDTLAKEYDYITLEAVDLFHKDDKEMSVITFKEDNTKFHFGATVLTQFIKKWVDACETIENVNELLKLEEVRIRISKKISKSNNVYYSVEILD